VLFAVGYHYVSERAPRSPHAVFPVTIKALARQLELLARSFELVSRDDLVAAVAGERSLPERACVVTFDDGLRCQVELALPVLERLDAPAIFFVPGRPLAEGRALFVHKVQALRERVDDPVFAERLGHELAAAGVQAPPVSDGEAFAHYRYDTPDAARVKFLLNMTLPLDTREAVVDGLFRHELGDERAFADELYMDRGQIAELERSRRAIGAHSYAHEPLALLSDDALDRDLEQVTTVLAEVTGARPRAFSYPHGTERTVDRRCAARLEASGYRVAFTTERALNRTLEQPLLLARFDANDAPGGARPCVRLDSGEVLADTGASAARERYLDEAAAC
jgi:peptidoglycan/xylan/chitin deacetylase (PgdA/CDA1 family)